MKREGNTYVDIVQDLFCDSNDSARGGVGRWWLDGPYGCHVVDVLAPSLFVFGIVARFASERPIDSTWRLGRLFNAKHPELSHEIGTYFCLSVLYR